MLDYKVVNGKKAGMRENVKEVCVLRKTICNYTGMLEPLYLRYHIDFKNVLQNVFQTQPRNGS